MYWNVFKKRYRKRRIFQLRELTSSEIIISKTDVFLVFKQQRSEQNIRITDLTLRLRLFRMKYSKRI